MRSSTRTEIRSLREVAHFLLPLLCCELCDEPLLDPKLSDKIFGDKAHSPLKNLKLTVHHRNGKHRDNHREPSLGLLKGTRGYAICGNTSLVHRPCHSKYEMQLNHHKRKVMKVQPLWKKAAELLQLILTKTQKLSVPEITFINKMNMRIGFESLHDKFTRYEIRRLKKLAAKVGEKK